MNYFSALKMKINKKLVFCCFESDLEIVFRIIKSLLSITLFCKAHTVENLLFLALILLYSALKKVFLLISCFNMYNIF